MTPLRILVTANPLYGHVNAVLPLAQAARDAGHDVVLATGPELFDHVEGHGIHALATGQSAAALRAIHGARWLEHFVAAAGARADDLVPWARGWRPDLVISEETELSGVVVAAASGARHVVHGLGQVPPPRVWDALSAGLLALGRRWELADADARLADATYLDLCPPSLRPDHPSRWARHEPLRPTPLGPGPDARLPPALDRLPFERTIHLTLGTVFNEGNPVLAVALAALRDLDANLVVTTGPGTDPARFGRQPPHVLIEPYLPLPLLLPRCVLVVSQAGSGGMFAALTNGLPQLHLPQGADQFGNADACARAGASLVLAPDGVAGPAIAEAARTLLDDPSYAAAASGIRAELEALPDPAAALSALTARTENRA